ncbi:MAG: hypothetical protein JO217_08380 [Acidobacteriaceae bacterium]|nr:hypothetical protein [Acidobacteriaceae bacterium]MBV9442695.1 hypothetical protein [Acidobacteriaceae bacterium]
MLQLSDPMLHIGAPIVVAPDLLASLRLAGHENSKGVTGDINQLIPPRAAESGYLGQRD